MNIKGDFTSDFRFFFQKKPKKKKVPSMEFISQRVRFMRVTSSDDMSTTVDDMSTTVPDTTSDEEMESKKGKELQQQPQQPKETEQR